VFTKTFLFAVIAACGVRSHQAASPDVQLGGDPAKNAKAAAAAQEWFEWQMQLQRQMQLQDADNRPTAPDEPTDEQPPEFAPPDEPPQEDQHFCCGSVDPKTWTGDDCSLLSKEHLVLCNTILYCPGKWTKEDGHVTCG
jgi:hypothetical protein